MYFDAQKKPGSKKSSQLGDQFTGRQRHRPKMGQIRPKKIEKYFCRKFDENFEKSKFLIFREKNRTFSKNQNFCVFQKKNRKIKKMIFRNFH